VRLTDPSHSVGDVPSPVAGSDSPSVYTSTGVNADPAYCSVVIVVSRTVDQNVGPHVAHEGPLAQFRSYGTSGYADVAVPEFDEEIAGHDAAKHRTPVPNTTLSGTPVAE
jgi:hypothetical protein